VSARGRRLLALGALVALALGSCGRSDTTPTIEVYAGSDATGTLIASGAACFVTDPAAVSQTIFVTASSERPLVSLHCTRDDTDVAPAARSGR